MITPLLGHGDGVSVLYRSDRIGQMAECLNVNSLSVLSDGEHYGCIFYKGRPVTVIIDNGVVEHIGYSLFTPRQRAAIGDIPCNFLERYSLDLDIPQIQEKDMIIRQFEDGVNFVDGSWQTLMSLCADTTQSLSMNLIAGKKYLFKWNDGSIVFPVDNELLYGRSQLENERRLPVELKRNTICTIGIVPSIESVVSSDGKIFELKGDKYYLDELNGNTYFFKNEWQQLIPVNDVNYPKETTANYLAGLLDGRDILVHVKMRVYGLKSVYFNVPLSSILAYSGKNECVGYCGMMAMEGDVIDGEWILRNEKGGYNHVFKLQIPKSVIMDGRGDIMAQLVPFVPTHSLKYLFGELQR